MWTCNTHTKAAGEQETPSEQRNRDPSSFVCIHEQQESPCILKIMETPGWQPTQKSSPMEREFGWIGPSTLIAERKNPKWQLEQEIVVRITVGFLNVWGFFAVPVSASKVVINSSILCCYTINLVSWVCILVWTCLLLWPWGSCGKLRCIISSENNNKRNKRRPHKESAECVIKETECSENWCYQDTGQRGKKKRYILTETFQWPASRGRDDLWHEGIPQCLVLT